MHYRILIAEDHAMLRQGLRAMLSSSPDFEVIKEVADGKSAVRECDQLRPDLVLMNLMLPGMNGLEATAHIKRRNPHTKVIALASLKNDEYVREVLKSGVDGYVVEDASYEELLVAIRSVLNGKMFLSPDISNHVVSSFLNGNAPTKVQGGLASLTLRERSVLKLVAEGRTNRSTAEFLSLSPKTVEKHRAKVMRKLGLRNAAELIYVALEMGLIERPGYASALTSAHEDMTMPRLV
jgi:DNA-binding NarL/FixJ family response regulator